MHAKRLTEPYPVLAGTVGSCPTFILLLQMHAERLTEPCPDLTGTLGPLSYLHPAVAGAHQAFN